MAELKVTDEAVRRFRQARAETLCGPLASTADWEGLKAAAPLIVADELERLAEEMSMREVTEEDVRARIAQFLGKPDEWCNCQAVRGTVNYPGPWHPAGDTTCVRHVPRRASELRGEA